MRLRTEEIFADVVNLNTKELYSETMDFVNTSDNADN